MRRIPARIGTYIFHSIQPYHTSCQSVAFHARVAVFFFFFLSFSVSVFVELGKSNQSFAMIITLVS